MKREWIAAAAVACGLLIGAGAPATAQTDRDGQQRWINVVNNSGTTIREFYMTDVDTRGWGDDRLGQNVIEPGESYRILPTARQRARGYCMYDMKLVLANGQSLERREVNLCQVTSLVCTNRGCSVR